MRPDLFATVITFDEALAHVLESARPIDRTETVDLRAADGRVSAVDLVAHADVPAFDRAAMDGYAVRTADLEGATAAAPVDLMCVGEGLTGAVPDRAIGRGECTAIATGAPLPAGADAVVMVEATDMGHRPSDIGHRTSAIGYRPSASRATTPTVRFVSPAATRQHISPRGSDMRSGDIVVRRGDALGPARVGSLAAIGLTKVEVFCRPTVAVFSSGNEVTAPGRPLPAGHVYDVNSFTVEAVVRRHGGSAMPLASVADSVEALSAALDVAATYDAVVVSGGSSVGSRDLMLDAVRARGQVIFHGIAVKPGKPTLLARIGRTVVFGMPGNPTSCLSNAYMLLVPFLRKAARLPSWQPVTLTAPLARRIASSPERHQFYPVRIEDGVVHPAFKSSGDITSLAGADGYIEIPAGIDVREAGSIVTAKLF